jgi:hypothetical protein
VPNGQTNNPIDLLWGRRQNTAAENQLHRLWLEFQADRKSAWDELEGWIKTSQSLLQDAKRQISALTPDPEPLIDMALAEACNLLREIRWRLPASQSKVFLPFLQHYTPSGHYIWVDRALRCAQKTEVALRQPVEERLKRPFPRKDRARASKEADDE